MDEHISKYQQIVDDLHKLQLDFRINDLDETLEVKYKSFWQEMTDTLEAIVKTELRELGYGKRKKQPISAARDAWVKLGDAQRYNPIQDYFEGLVGEYEPQQTSASGQVWSQPYLIPQLASHFDNPDGYLKIWLFRWMTGAVSKIFDGERNPMLVLVGEQEMGKSWFSRWLCPLSDEYFSEGAIQPDSKDYRLSLTRTFIQEVSELGATTRRQDIESLKDIITRKAIRDRPPFARRPINKPVNCSFIGSVNFDGVGFLNDPTGTTRFLASQIDDVDFSYANMSIDEIWAEAVWFYQNSTKPWELTTEEKKARSEINSQFEIPNAMDYAIEECFVITNKQDDFITTMDIRDRISTYYKFSNEQSFNRDLARVLHKRGLKQTREKYTGGRHRRGWAGIKPYDPDEEVEFPF